MRWKAEMRSVRTKRHSRRCNESVVFYYPQIGVGTTGPSTFHTDLIFVNTGAATSLLAEIFASSGNPLTVRIEPSRGDPVVGDSMELELPQGASIELGLRGAGRDIAGLRASHHGTRGRWRGRLQFPG